MLITEDNLQKKAKRVSPTVPPELPHIRKLFLEKVVRIMLVKHIEGGFVRWDIRCFKVPKGEFDIRLVYDGTSGGVNLIVWVRSFFLAMSRSLGRLLVVGTYLCDLDIGEMFCNFPLDVFIRSFCGVNLSRFDELDNQIGDNIVIHPEKRFRHCRTWMGFRSSLFLAIRQLSIAVESAVGDPLDDQNPFHWSKIALNLPGDEQFDPARPWLFKWNEKAGQIAGDYVSFVDDFRVTGFSVENCWNCARRLASRSQHLGMQEAARKRSAPTLKAEV